MISLPIFNLVVVNPHSYEITGTVITLPHDDKRVMPRVRKDALDWFGWIEGIPLKIFLDDYGMTPSFYVDVYVTDRGKHLTLFGEFPDDQGIVFKMWMSDAGYPDGLYL